MKVFAALFGMAAALSVAPQAANGQSLAPRGDDIAGAPFDITTFAGQHCGGAKQGETIVHQDASECVNYSNAGSYRIHAEGGVAQCHRIHVNKFHGTGCTGTIYQTTVIPTDGNPTCINFNAGGPPHGSGRFSCAD